ncbi:MAG: hypothetical protein ABIJ91_02900 [Candidatus Kuenenbacteria bacterium]
MKKHLIIVLCLVVLYFVIERIVGGFDPQLTPLWLMPTVIAWMISIAVTLDKGGLGKQILVALYISMLAILGAAFVGTIKSPKADLEVVYYYCFIISIIVGTVIVLTRVFYDAETYGKSELATHAISLSQFATTIAVLTLI